MNGAVLDQVALNGEMTEQDLCTTNGTIFKQSAVNGHSIEQDGAIQDEQFNATDNAPTLGFCLPELFEHVVRSQSNDLAMISGTTKLTYGTLNSLVNGLSHILVNERNVRPGSVVGLVLNRSTDFIIALLAILKTGAIYMPIEPSLPTERVKRMIKDASPAIIITSRDTSAVVLPWENLHLNLDTARDVFSNSDPGDPAIDLRPEDLAYIIYTSGSTGVPKGAEANHGALCNLLLAMQREPGCKRGDRLLAVASVSFDISIADMLLPLVSGATLVLAQSHELRDPDALLGLMRRHAITMSSATPSFWQMLLDSGWNSKPRLKSILAAGEPLSYRLAQRLLARADNLWNGYGPSEATIYASIGRIHQHDKDISIGTPVSNCQLHVLRAEDLSPVPLGSVGELYIGGVGVTCGYHNKPELTRSSFLENPFDQGRLYRTGDLARFIGPGKLTLVGRADSQVKVRGYRIELGDISTAISDHEEVSAAVVVVRDNQIVAYCVYNKNDDQNVSDGDVSLDSMLRPWLAKLLPAYMMPAFFVEVDTFPMTVNGKIDRNALPDPKVTTDTRSTKARPRTDMERRILTTWIYVLGHKNIGIDDNFFHIGGTSLHVPHVKIELEKSLDRSVLAAKLFEYYTIRALAEYLEHIGTDHDSLTNGDIPSTSAHRKQHQVLGDRFEDIAIISMACRLPGGITSPDDYWAMLRNGKHGITKVPNDRWKADALYDADPNAIGKSYSCRGGFIDSGIDSFDAPFFGISPTEARTMDPTQHIVLETCWEGFERAGYTMQGLRSIQTGVFIGQSNISAHNITRNLADLDGYSLTGSSSATISGRVSYTFGLEGPSLTVDTACSSSLVSTHLACTALRQGECDMAVAGGITLLSPGLHVDFSRLKGLSPDGHCRAFSADSQGTGLSEGSTAVVLKRLSDAQRDGDAIHAVLRGSTVNHGGRRSANLTIPSSSAQERLIRTTLDVSGLSPSDIDYIEAHGTATKLGDPIEGTALSEVFSRRSADEEPLWIGSSKSNLGHTQGAAGLAGVMKVALAMQNNTLPKTLGVTQPTPLIDWQKANMALVLDHQPWIANNDRPRRAGVSSFGIGGTNAHMIVQEAPSHLPKADSLSHNGIQSQPLLPFPVSAQSDIALRQYIGKIQKHVECSMSRGEDASLADLSYSLATTRTHFRYRRVLLADSKTDLIEKLASCSINRSSDLSPLAGVVSSSTGIGDEAPHLAMLFTGQGSQRLRMGKGLCHAYPLFRQFLEDITSYFSELELPLLDVMWAEPQSEFASLLHRTDFAQPAIFALEVALWRLWQSWGVHPQILLGHSVGELAVAHVAGILSLHDACRLVAARGRLMQGLVSSRPGSMAALETSATEVTVAISALGLHSKVEIAGYNTPTQTVVSGDADAVGLVVDCLTNQLACKATRLNVSHAFHSYHMDDMLPAFQNVAETIHYNSPKLPIISSLTGKLAEPGELERSDYWVKQARRAVRFSDSIHTLYHQQNANICLELGPQPVLSGIAASCLTANLEPDAQLPALLPSLKSGKQEDEWAMLNSLAQLHVRHVPIDWPGYYAPFDYKRVELPTYPFQRQRYNYHTVDQSQNTTAGREKSAELTDGHQHDDSVSRLDAFQFEITWTPVDQSEFKVIRVNTSWGYICPAGDVPWARDARDTLLRAGSKLVQVERIEDATNLSGLICFWDDSIGDEVPRKALDLTAKALAQLQAAASLNFSLPLVWITRQAVGVQTSGCDNSVDSVKHHSVNDNGSSIVEHSLYAAPLWGLMRTARSEHSDLRLRLIDLTTENNSYEALASALMVDDDLPECALREGNISIPQIQRVNASRFLIDRQTINLRMDEAVLITGGLGGIGQQVAKWLASTYQISDLVLTSRRGEEAPGAGALVNELARLGAKATVVACDAGDFHSIKAVVESFGQTRPLRGVIHAAGLVDNGVLSTLTPQQCATTFKPKVDGAWNLHCLTQNMDLDIFMMFSSISGVLGMPGLGNYAAANTFLDALAHLRRSQGLPATSVAFGTWGGEGMAANLNGRTTLAHLAQFGLDPLQPEDGLELLKQAVSSGRALTVAASLDLKRLRSNLEEEKGSIPFFFRNLLGNSDDDKNRYRATTEAGHESQLRKALREAPVKQHPGIVLKMVQETVGKALGFSSTTDVPTDVPLQDIGFDSLTAVLIRNHLANLTELKTLSIRNVTWNHPNLKSLSQYLLTQLESEIQANGTMSGAVNVEEKINSTISTNGLSSVPDLSLARRGCLDPSLTFDKTATLQRPTSVFVTGATGFVGAFILHELLQQGTVAYCLVRAQDAEHGQQRLVDALDSYDLWDISYAPLLHPIVGDIAEPLFGLHEHDFERLAHQINAICHAGALVDWMRPLDEYIGPNVVSTHEVLRLASRGHGTAIHVVSTLATLPKHMGYEVSEHDREYGYSTSKYMAERMVSAARWRGAKASIYRVPFVTASATSGHFRKDSGDFLHNLIAGCVEMGTFPSLDADLQVVLPVDYLSKTIVSAMLHDLSRIGHDYDFRRTSPPSTCRLFHLMASAAVAEDENRGYQTRPFSEWQQQALAHASAHPKSPIARIAAVIDGLTGESALELFKGLPPGERVFGGEVYPAPDVDEQVAQRYWARIREARLTA